MRSSFYALILAALSLLACTRETDLTPEGRGQVVVVCILTEENQQKLTLELTDIATQEDREALAGAEVILYDESARTEAGLFIKGEGNEWWLDYAAIPGHSYQLVISVLGREKVSASTTMPQRSHIVLGTGYLYYGMSYGLNSLPEGPVWVMGMNHDHRGTGKHDAAKKIATSLTTADSFNVTGEVFHAFDYFEEIIKYADPGKGNDFFYPNVEGQPLYDTMFRIPSVQESSRQSIDANGWFQVAGFFRTGYYPVQFEPPEYLTETDGYVLFISPSEEYDRFLREVISKKMQQQAMRDYASLFSRKNTYTNIVNGLGVFGAKTDQKLPWTEKCITHYN